MFYSCRQLVLTKNESNFVNLINNKLRLTLRHFRQSHVTLLAKSLNINPASNSYKHEKRKEAMDLSSFRNILRQIEVNRNYLNHIPLFSIINTFNKGTYQIRLCPKEVKLKEFNNLCKLRGFKIFIAMIKSNILELTPNDLMELLGSFHRLNAPLQGTTIEKLIERLIDVQERMTFEMRVNFYCILNDSESEQLIEQSKKLEKIILKNLEEKIYTRSTPKTILALIIAVYDFVPDDMRVKLLKYVLSLEEWESYVIFKKFLFVLDKLPPSHSSYNSIRNQYFERITDECSKDANFCGTFLLTYRIMIRRNKAEYNEKFIDDIVNRSLKLKMNHSMLERLTSALCQLDHVNYNLLDYAAYLLKNNSDWFTQNHKLLFRVIEALADSNHDQGEKNRWGDLVPKIKDSQALDNMLRSFCASDMKLLYVSSLHLCSLGIYHDGALKYLSKHVNVSFEDFKSKEDDTDKFFFGILNESIRMFHPSFEKSFLDEEVLENIKESKKFVTIPYSVKDLLSDVETCLESVSNVKNSVLRRCVTKGGMCVDGAFAMNDEGEFYSFSSLEDDENKIHFLEDIPVPSDFKIFPLNSLVEGTYSRNTYSFKGIQSQRVKILEAMGYTPVNIFQDIWNTFNKVEKEKYLFNQINNNT